MLQLRITKRVIRKNSDCGLPFAKIVIRSGNMYLPRTYEFEIPACCTAIVSDFEQYNLSLCANNAEYQYLELRHSKRANYLGINNGTAKLWWTRFMINLAIVGRYRGRKVLTSFCRNLLPADISRAMRPEMHERIEIVSSIVYHVRNVQTVSKRLRLQDVSKKRAIQIQ